MEGVSGNESPHANKKSHTNLIPSQMCPGFPTGFLGIAKSFAVEQMIACFGSEELEMILKGLHDKLDPTSGRFC